MNMTELRRSVVLERQADLLAASLSLGEATSMMREVNAIRRRQFGMSITDPNELREMTAQALS